MCTNKVAITYHIIMANDLPTDKITAYHITSYNNIFNIIDFTGKNADSHMWLW